MPILVGLPILVGKSRENRSRRSYFAPKVVGCLGASDDDDADDGGPFSPEIRLTSELPPESRVAVTNRLFVPRSRRATTVLAFGLPFEDAPPDAVGRVLDQWCSYLDANAVRG